MSMGSAARKEAVVADAQLHGFVASQAVCDELATLFALVPDDEVVTSASCDTPWDATALPAIGSATDR